ncbi:MAG: hypothetical protein EPN14_10850 [Gallionella sp.]|nr:MAG: hypothetical protein EPN14_10850 [Gallionella sp.]
MVRAIRLFYAILISAHRFFTAFLAGPDYLVSVINQRCQTMDLAFLVLIFVFFVLTAALAFGCDKLREVQ